MGFCTAFLLKYLSFIIFIFLYLQIVDKSEIQIFVLPIIRNPTFLTRPLRACGARVRQKDEK